MNCYAGTAQISGPGDAPTAQSAIDYQVSWTHQWSHGQFSMDAYRQSQAGQLVNATVTAAAAGLPADVQSAIGQYYSTICPLFAAPAIYVSQPVNDTTRIYQGFDLQARVALGRAVTVIPSYSSNASFYVAADPRFTGIGSTLILGQQIFGRPIHKANLTIDALHPPSKFEFLLNAQYVGINNQQNIAPYVDFSAGIAHPLGNGMLTIFETNLFNTQSGLFSTINGAIPQPLSGGGFLLTVARPLAPRTLQASFAVNTGARPGAGFARGAGRGGAGLAANATPAPNAPRAAAFGFGRLNFIPPPPGTDPLAVATSRSECTADLQPLAQKVLAELGEAGRAYAAGATALPPVGGIAVTPHGAASGTWYFGLGPDIPRSLFRRPEGQGPQARARGGGPGGPGGPGRGRRAGLRRWSPARLPAADLGRSECRRRRAAPAIHAEPRTAGGVAALPGARLVLVRHGHDGRRGARSRLRRAHPRGAAVAGSVGPPGTPRRRFHRLRSEPGDLHRPAARARIGRGQPCTTQSASRTIGTCTEEMLQPLPGDSSTERAGWRSRRSDRKASRPSVISRSRSFRGDSGSSSARSPHTRTT